jgi:hypothetical protein
MRKAIVALPVAIAFLFGFFVGRRFPPHHYVRYERGGLLVDTATGKLCDPIPRPGAPFPPYDASAAHQ